MIDGSKAFQIKNIEKAISHYSKALNLATGTEKKCSIKSNLAILYAHTGDTKWASETLEETMQELANKDHSNSKYTFLRSKILVKEKCKERQTYLFFISL